MKSWIAVLVMMTATGAWAQAQEAAGKESAEEVHIGRFGPSPEHMAREAAGKVEQAREAAGTPRHKVAARLSAIKRDDAPGVHVGAATARMLLSVLGGREKVVAQREGRTGLLTTYEKIGVYARLDASALEEGTGQRVILMKILQVEPDGRGLVGAGLAKYAASCPDPVNCQPASWEMKDLTQTQGRRIAAEIVEFWSAEGGLAK